MKRFVVDASLMVPLYFDEPFTAAAVRALRDASGLSAPDFIAVEVGNVIWKRVRRGEITQEQARAICNEVLAFPLERYPAADLLSDALRLAVTFDRTIDDCLYLALALRVDAVMLTADRRLVNALASTPMAAHIAWIGDRD